MCSREINLKFPIHGLYDLLQAIELHSNSKNYWIMINQDLLSYLIGHHHTLVGITNQLFTPTTDTCSSW